MPEDQDRIKDLHFFGLNGDSGEYLVPSMTTKQFTNMILGKNVDEDYLREMDRRNKRSKIATFGLEPGRDSDKLSEAGWGVIFAHAERENTPAIKEAMADLLALRKEQAGELYRDFSGEDAFRPDDTKTKFLARYGVSFGDVDPTKVPYYLLIVGSPESIPYQFQFMLDVQFAVGRIHFETSEEYGRYAESVVASESGVVSLDRRLTFFGPKNPDDGATALSSEFLLDPLSTEVADANPEWKVDLVAPDKSNVATLKELMGGGQTPALLFTASHGLWLPLKNARHKQDLGAIVCQNWLGRYKSPKPIPRSTYFAGSDVPEDGKLAGLMHFNFSCFGAGTPRLNIFSHHDFAIDPRIGQPYQMANTAVVSPLPKTLLSHKNGGALAVIGHVERAWGASFYDQGPRLTTFRGVIKRLAGGSRIGYAMEGMNKRYGEIATQLTEVLDTALIQVQLGAEPDNNTVASLWMANHDARNYIIIGDPAARLPLSKNGASDERMLALTAKTLPALKAEAEPALVAEEPARRRSYASGDAKTSSGVGGQSFAPLPDVPDGYKEEHPRLYDAWVGHVAEGYENNSQLFTRVMKGFMRSYYLTLAMYVAIFVIGIGLFVAAAVLAIVQGEVVAGAVFAGLGVVSFVSFFIRRPVESVEENLNYITWLGIIYNSYWTRLAWSFNEDTAGDELEKATDNSIRRLQGLLDRHAKSVEDRPGMSKENDDGAGG